MRPRSSARLALTDELKAPVGRNNHVRVGGEAIWRTWYDLR
jgi:hypothetical protein